jgi:alpha-glucoside transport system permease protein
MSDRTTSLERPKPGAADTVSELARRRGQAPRRTRRSPMAESPLAWLTNRVGLLLVCLLWSIPTLGMLISSVRSPEDIASSGWWTALATPLDTTAWTVENYQDVLLSEGMGQAFLNSLLVTLPATLGPLLIAAFAGYAFSWMRFPARGLLFTILVALLVVPLQIAYIPLLQLFGNLGITGTFFCVWLAHAGFGMPLAVFLLRNFMSTIDPEIFESARLDGASERMIFWRIAMPLSVPALASLAIFQFLWVWNDLLVALVFLGTGPEVAVVTQHLASLVGTRGQDWHLLTAGAFVTMALPLAVFFALQRYFVRGLTAGSVKG